METRKLEWKCWRWDWDLLLEIIGKAVARKKGRELRVSLEMQMHCVVRVRILDILKSCQEELSPLLLSLQALSAQNPNLGLKNVI